MTYSRLMPKAMRVFIILVCFGIVSTCLGATRINVLWIGNSLTTAPWCSYEGWLATQVAANANMAQTNIELACYPAMMGATNLASHWTAQRGVPELTLNPVVRKPSDPWATENVDKYDYLVLQTYKPGPGSALTAESTAICKYTDLALTKGTKTVLFACWDIPASYTGEMNAFNAIYNRYKSQGMLIAPLYDIHKLIWPEKALTYLYVTNDNYHHENANGVYINVVVFNYLFTTVKPSNLAFSKFPTCTDVTSVQGEKSYLDGKAEAGLALYYNLNGTGIQQKPAASRAIRKANQGQHSVYDISGKRIGSSFGSIHGAVFIDVNTKRYVIN